MSKNINKSDASETVAWKRKNMYTGFMSSLFPFPQTSCKHVHLCASWGILKVQSSFVLSSSSIKVPIWSFFCILKQKCKHTFYVLWSRTEGQACAVLYLATLVGTYIDSYTWYDSYAGYDFEYFTLGHFDWTF